MTRLTWNQNGSNLYETGVSCGVLYPQDSPGVSWNGLMSLTEPSSGSESTVQYIDGVKVLNNQVLDSFSATIEAYTYPNEFIEYEESGLLLDQKLRKSFGLCYKTLIGNQEDGLDHGYKLHLVYNMTVSSTTKTYTTLNSSASASTFTWLGTTIPIPIAGARATAHLVIDSTKAHAWVMESIEDILYGNSETAPILPHPDEIILHFEEAAVVQVIDNGDGTFTVTGPDEWVHLTGDSTFEFSFESAVYIDEVSYTISSA